MKRSGWITFGLGLILITLTLRDLWPVWRDDSTLSHAPLLLAFSLLVFWKRRHQLVWVSAESGGLALLAGSVGIGLFGQWSAIPALSALSTLGIAAGSLWFLGGKASLRRVLAPLGLLLFTLPWPTALIVRLQFWLQLTSSTYAALGAGLLGIPVHRDGVTLHIVPHSGESPIYSILVAQKCSGLSSLMALLSLGYLAGWFTPIRFQGRLIFLAAVLPLTLAANSVRLVLILLAGSAGNARLAGLVHDNEQPVLMLFCGLGLMGLRALLLSFGSLRPSLQTPRPESSRAEDRPEKEISIEASPISHR